MSSTDPPALVTTRRALHALAAQVISPVRQRATGGRIALEARPGGFGTHDLPAGGWAGVRGTVLVAMNGSGVARTEPITTLRSAGFFFGAPDAADLPDEPLLVDAEAAARLADAWAGGATALQALTSSAELSDDVTRIDLWPEHFDIAVTLGSEDTGARANYGVSPGDDAHPEPYAYVGPWSLPDGADPARWNAVGYRGAEIAFTGAEETLAFFQGCRGLLAGA